jgi:glucosamine-6-phosphate deaminase
MKGSSAMDIRIAQDAEVGSRFGAGILATAIRQNPDLVLGLATGKTPLCLYEELVRLHSLTGLDFSRVSTFNLDEYCGLAADHPCSYHHFMWEHLFDRVNISAHKVHIPDGMASDLEALCDGYEREIRSLGGIEIQLLGIGKNGHIGFNEPYSPLNSRTRVTELAPETVEANSECFGGVDKVPRNAVTMGIATILQAQHCLLLAFGSSKADPVSAMVQGAVTSALPASMLQGHPKVTVVLDEAAAAGLSNVEKYERID